MIAQMSMGEKRHQSLIAFALDALDGPAADGLAHLRDGLRRYLEDRIETGGFLRSVLENDLAAAVAHAHPSLTMTQMKALTGLISETFPALSWGSPDRVAEWLQGNTEGKTG